VKGDYYVVAADKGEGKGVASAVLKHGNSEFWALATPRLATRLSSSVVKTKDNAGYSRRCASEGRPDRAGIDGLMDSRRLLLD